MYNVHIRFQGNCVAEEVRNTKEYWLDCWMYPLLCQGLTTQSMHMTEERSTFKRVISGILLVIFLCGVQKLDILWYFLQWVTYDVNLIHLQVGR